MDMYIYNFWSLWQAQKRDMFFLSLWQAQKRRNMFGYVHNPPPFLHVLQYCYNCSSLLFMRTMLTRTWIPNSIQNPSSESVTLTTLLTIIHHSVDYMLANENRANQNQFHSKYGIFMLEHAYKLIICIRTLCKVWLDWHTWVNSIHAELEKNISIFFLQILTDKCIWQQIFLFFLKELITLMIIALLKRTFYVDLSLKSPTPFETLPWQQMATNKIQLNYLITCLIYFFPDLALILVFKNCYNQHEFVHSEKS